MNDCKFMGRLTHDPELRNVGVKGVAVCNFSIAVTRTFKRQNGETSKEVVFVNLEAWDTGAQTIAKYFKKGSPIIVRTSYRPETYEKDGQKRTKDKFRVDEFWFPLDKTKNASEAKSSENTDVVADKNETEIPF
jgi:single-strand DNA-binding protein